jgi:hypothetical protein
MLSNITVLPDESLGGIEREYREVKRKAAEGELAMVIRTSAHSFSVGTIVKAISEKSAVTDGVRFMDKRGELVQTLVHTYGDYVTLEPTDIVHIAGERLRMVVRKATSGECVIIVSSDKTKSVGCAFRHKIGEVGDVDSRLPDRAGVNGWYILDGDYRVLEPLATAPLLSEQSAQDQAAATISALALRLETLEETIRRMGTDIRVAQEDIDIMDESVAYDVRKLEAEVAALKEAATTCLRST